MQEEKVRARADEHVLWGSKVLVSGWKSGKFDGRRAVALGVRVGREFANQFFDKRWDAVLVELDDKIVSVRLTKTFWTTCPELRSPAIGAWMKKQGLAPWPKGRPPELRLTPMGRNKFRLAE
jgi:hypothetical protein